MTTTTLNNLTQQIQENQWNNTILKLDGRGEPLLHPQITNLVSLIKRNNPKNILTLTTNGDYISQQLFQELFDMGLNVLFIDCYDSLFTRKNTIATWTKQTKHPTIKVHDFYEDNFNLYHDKFNTDEQQVVLIDDIVKNNNKREDRTLLNHAGNIIPENFEKQGISFNLPKTNPCNKPHRELTIRYDGTISFCCEDASNIIPLGNINKNHIQEIWKYNHTLNKIRQELQQGNREKIIPCSQCSYIGT